MKKDLYIKLKMDGYVQIKKVKSYTGIKEG